MRACGKGLLFGLSVLMGLLWVGEASTEVASGGSRLLFYFANRSFVPGSAVGSAFTLFFVTNAAPATDTKVAVKFYRGDTCQETTPVIYNMFGLQTLTFDSSVEVPTFPEGVMEVFFVNGAGQPVRFDRGVGSSAVVDKNLVGVARLAAAAMHSDNRASGALNSLIADNANTGTFAPSELLGSFPDPSVVTAHLALFAPGTAPGTVAPDRLLEVFFVSNSAGGVEESLNVACGRALTLATVRGLAPAQFRAAYPAGGLVKPVIDGQPKGIVGWLIEMVRLAGPIDLLFGQRLEGIVVENGTAHP